LLAEESSSNPQDAGDMYERVVRGEAYSQSRFENMDYMASATGNEAL